MTSLEKEKIIKLREENYSYTCIAKAIGISPNTVKSFCFRNNIEARGNRKNKLEKHSLSICKYCGVRLDNTHGQKKSFCCKECRESWWKENRHKNKK